MAQYLLKNAAILTMDSAFTLYEDGYLAVEGDAIREIGPSSQLEESRFAGYTVLDCRGKIVTPGMINTHSHLSMMVFRSLADDVPDRLKRYLFPLERTAMTRKMAVAGANYAFAELLLGGVTTVYDAYYFEDDIAREAEKAGIRAVLSETVLDSPSPSAKEPYGGIPYTREFVKKWKGHPRITPAVNCHAIYTNDTAHLQECHRIARENDVIFCMHVAEMGYEQEGCLRDHGMTPVAYLDSIGVLDEKFLAAHSILLDENDLDIYARRGVKVSYNAGSNAKGAKGVAPIPAMRQRGITVSLGTDGPMSGNTIDILTQLPLVGKVQKLFSRDRSLFPAKEILEMATIGGAKALGLEAVTGSLEVGKKADLLIFETDSVNMNPIYDYYSVIVYSANPSNVESTMVDGELVMHKRKLLTLDLGESRRQMLAFRDEIAAIARELDKAVL